MIYTLPLQATRVDSFAPAQSPLPSRLYRLPRGFPARGVDSHFPDAHPFGLPVHVAPLPAGSILVSGLPSSVSLDAIPEGT